MSDTNPPPGSQNPQGSEPPVEGSSQAPSYGSQPSYGSSQPPAYGSSEPPAYGSSEPPAYGAGAPGGQAPYGGTGGQAPYGGASGYPQGGNPPGGYDAPPPGGYFTPGGAPPPPPRSNGLAIGSLIAGIVSIPAMCCGGWPGLIIGIAALILGVLGLRKARTGLAGQRGLAITGIVLGLIGTILSIIMLALVASFGPDFTKCSDLYQNDQEKMGQCVMSVIQGDGVK